MQNKKQLTFGSKVLIALLHAETEIGILHTRLHSTAAAIDGEETEYYAYLRLQKELSSLRKKGWIRYVGEEKKLPANKLKVIKLTDQGEVEALFAKMQTSTPVEPDSKWRLIVFDIPENNRDIRDKLRCLLKGQGFIALQASVYISPRPLNESCIEYLKRSKLMNFIRILRVDKMDDDSDLKKKFGLK